MDETPLWMDMPGDRTVKKQGTRSIPVKLTGHEKARFTVVLVAMANAKKLKVFIVLRRVRAVPEFTRIPGVFNLSL